MQIVDTSSETLRPFSVLAVKHKDQAVFFDVDSLNLPTGMTSERTLEFINAYFASQHSNIQQGIFDAYVQLEAYLKGVVDPDMLYIKLVQGVKKLYSFISYDSVRKWAIKNADIRIPPSICERYEDLEISERSQTNQNYRDRTYLRSDYLELVYMAIYLKPMIPIWAEYAKILDQAASRSTYRDYHAMGLITQTELPNIEPLHRLRRYIETSVPSDRDLATAILGGLGTAQVPDWLLSTAVIRKLILIELSSYEETSSVISVIYHNVKNAINSIGRKFSDNVRDKPKPKGESEDDENKSFVESYKVQQQHSDGDLMALSVYTEDAYRMAEHLCPDLPKQYLDKIMGLHGKLMETLPSEGQMTIIRWVMAPVLPPRGLDHVSRVSLCNCRAVTQAVLWHWDFPDLALLLNAIEVRDNLGMLVGGLESRNRIPKEYVDQFMTLYPHAQERRSKDGDRKTNAACIAIDKVANDLVKCDWLVIAPQELMQHSDLCDDRGLMTTPADIRARLSQLVLQIATAQERV
jgi:hypothetical protein